MIFPIKYLKDLYKLGARKIGVFSAPPLGCVPSQRTLVGGSKEECAKDPNEASKMFNDKLSAKLGYLNDNLLDAKVVYIDVYYPLLDLITNPNKYGNIPFSFIISKGLLFHFFFFKDI